MKPIIVALTFALLTGCVTRQTLPSTAQPFADLYGAKNAQWLNGNHQAIFSRKADKVSFLEVEAAGFSALDAENQKRYLVVLFCTHQRNNAEGGSQIWRLISALKCPTKNVADYVASLEEEDVKLYAAYLGGSLEQFRTNSRHFLKE